MLHEFPLDDVPPDGGIVIVCGDVLVTGHHVGCGAIAVVDCCAPVEQVFPHSADGVEPRDIGVGCEGLCQHGSKRRWHEEVVGVDEEEVSSGGMLYACVPRSA